MSIEAINWAKKQRVSPTQKLVLLVLADCADSDGLAFPSMSYLEEVTGLSDKAIRNAKRAMMSAGFLVKEDWMRLNDIRLSMTDISEKTEPRSSKPARRSRNTEPRSASSKTEPRSAMTEPASIETEPRSAVPEPPITTNNHHSIPPTPLSEKSRSKKSTASKRGHRLPDGWQPSQELLDYAAAHGLDPERETEDFRDYWHSKPGAGGVKLDWAATWRTWCRRSADRHQQRFPGAGNVTPFPARQQRNTRPPRDPFAGFADSFTDVEIPELSPEDKALMRRYRS
ncbi:helix-turn-helix domain-containing protein [Parasaccharibacter sp. TMW2.1882]|uniref:helix-turn-helix domain-containing protein n=1 Tax=Parasaccharibacter sp. TMW2.1882 TaxID=2039286 RepID=UPI00201323E7|nr:helix-turn-helix domain-containing protein [Parasaccharibacter sp. TMW2.1882]